MKLKRVATYNLSHEETTFALSHGAVSVRSTDAVRVIIPTCTDDLIVRALASMEESEPGSSALAVVGDNGLSFDIRERFPAVSRIAVPRPFIHMQALNLMAASCPLGAAIIVMGDDAAFLTPGWLSITQRLLGEWPEDLGMVNFFHDGYLGFGDYVSWLNDREPEVRNSDIFRSIWMMPLLGSVIPAATRNRIGDFDERFAGYGYDDIDYCVSMLHKGLEIGITQRVCISHIGCASYGDGELHRRDEEADYNRVLFYEKRGLPLSGPGYPETRQHLNFASCGCII